MAYIREPMGAEDADSAVEVVRKTTRLGPLFVSCRWIFVAGALGKGKDTCMGACDAPIWEFEVAMARRRK